jgi:hypothetical protein
MQFTEILEATPEPNPEHPEHDKAAFELAQQICNEIMRRRYIYHPDYQVVLDPEAVGQELWAFLTYELFMMYTTEELKEMIDDVWADTHRSADPAALAKADTNLNIGEASVH